ADGGGEEEYRCHVDSALQEAQKELGLPSTPEAQPGPMGWGSAGELVKNFHPVPWVICRIVRTVFGRADRMGNALPSLFHPLDRLLFQAVSDPVLGGDFADGEEVAEVTVTKAIEQMGLDVAGAICFVHAVCRRLTQSLPERIAQALLDDALLRTKIGFLIGQTAPRFDAGRGMLAGFSGRSGLAILIASGTTEAAQDALRLMAQGVEIRDVGLRVYGCEPLQVSALTLAIAGCNREAAFGIASFGISTRSRDLVPGSEAARWLAAFSLTEHLRMGNRDRIEPFMWNELGLDQSKSLREDLMKRVRLVQRRGHGWQWMTWPQLMMEAQR
ncbi:MAG: hypothetical protein KDD44_14425, partial [Bdellovibrionales bacterium]|nr:hypothetical protein [Bdellovibrionales bacterium]